MSDAPKKPRTQTVALRYSAETEAPVVVAKGYGSVGENIIKMAKEHGVFIHESPELVELLMQVNLDEKIPPALYAVVAELLAWLYNLESQAQDTKAAD